MEWKNNGWENILKPEMEKEYFLQLKDFLKNEYSTKKIYPPENKIFNLFNHIKFDSIKIVILGQDPYHGFGQGNGIAFSVNKGIKIPPSLQNIYKELAKEYKDEFKIPSHGDLTSWVEQGVFLLNTVFTVEDGKPNSHAKKGWEIFTDFVIKSIDEKSSPIVFMLWGNPAKKKKVLIKNTNHLILESVHPSPFSANDGFFGNNHFIEADNFLEKNNINKINWQL
ncbi:MAG: uracil-DNA glycosylase [Fusobacteriaceae bacterium]